MNTEDNIKKKRVVTRVGDIFCVELKEYKFYLQFIAVDASYLNSTTVRVFKKKYPLSYIFNPNEVINDEVYFYAHTFLQPGLKGGVWIKAGKNKDIGDLKHILFRDTSSWTPQCPKSYKWRIGGINGEYTMIGELTEEYKNKTDDAVVVPPIDIVEKFKTGKYRGPQPY